MNLLLSVLDTVAYPKNVQKLCMDSKWYTIACTTATTKATSQLRQRPRLVEALLPRVEIGHRVVIKRNTWKVSYEVQGMHARPH